MEAHLNERAQNRMAKYSTSRIRFSPVDPLDGVGDHARGRRAYDSRDGRKVIQKQFQFWL